MILPPDATRDHKIRQQRSSLECWFWALAAASLMVILMVARISGTAVPELNAFHTYNSDRLQKFGVARPPVKVVLIGDSTLRYATLPELKLNALAADLGVDMRFIRITHDEAHFNDFVPIAQAILDVNPTLIIVHAPLYVRDRTNYRDVRLLQKYIIWALLRDGNPLNTDALDQQSVQASTTCLRDKTAADFEQFARPLLENQMRRLRQHSRLDKDGSSALALQKFIALARSMEISVKAVETPYTQLLKRSTDDSGEILANEVVRGLGVEAWTYPDVLPDKDYCDLVHLDEPGRKKYSKWLVLAVNNFLQSHTPINTHASDKP